MSNRGEVALKSFDLPAEMYRSYGVVNAAYNRILGEDLRSPRRNLAVGFFDENLQLFAWSHMMDRVTTIGQVADDWAVYTRWQQQPRDAQGRVQMRHLMLSRPMQEGDL